MTAKEAIKELRNIQFHTTKQYYAILKAINALKKEIEVQPGQCNKAEEA